MDRGEKRPNSRTYSNWEKSLSSLLFTVTSTNRFYPPSKRGLKRLVCYVNIVYGNLKSDNSQDDAQT